MTEFGLREPGDVVGRPRQAMQKRVVVLGVVLFMVALALLIANTPSA